MLRRWAIAALRFSPLRVLAEPAARGSLLLGRRLTSILAHSAAPVGSSETYPGRSGVIRIEFLGPSGIGKTTLSGPLLADRHLRAELRTFGGLLSTSKALLGTSRDTWGSPATDYDSVYASLLGIKTKQLTEMQIPINDHAHLLRFFVENLLEDIRLSGPSSRRVVMREDGLLHNFGSAICRESDTAGLTGLLQRRIVLRLVAPAEVVARRAMVRQAAGGDRPQYVGKSAAQVEQAVRSALERVDATVEALRSAGVPILDMDVSRDGAPPLASAVDFILSNVSLWKT
jgi:hypothetical protein